MEKQQTDLLLQAAAEIRSLRNQNQLLSARLDMFDKCMVLLHTAPQYPGLSAGEDIAWKIDKFISSKSQQDH